MGQRGMPPKPTALRVLHGDRKDRINTAEPVPSPGLPVCPAEASDPVRQVWDYTVAELAVMKVVTPADRDALLAYCEAVVTHRRASAELAQDDLLVVGAMGGYKINPLVQVQRDAAAVIKQFSGAFGLTPSSRSQIRVEGAVAKTEGRDAGRLLSG